jgi:hypothetical protein
MIINQLFFAMAGLFATGIGFLKYYLDAKIEPIYKAIERIDRRDEALPHT